MKKNKTCPSCRAKVELPPTPIYFIKDLVSSIAPVLWEGGALLGPPAENEEEGRKVVEGEDLWAGIFSKREARRTMMDYEDGVLRCGHCGHEVEDGVCVSLDEICLSLSPKRFFSCSFFFFCLELFLY